MRDATGLFEDVRTIFQQVAAAYRCAEITIEESHPCGRAMVELRCTQPSTLPVSACVIQDQVDLYLASGTNELVKRRRDPSDVILKNMEPIVRAAAEGRIEQVVRGPESNPVWTRTVIRLEDGSIKGIRGHILAFLWPGPTRHLRHTAYR